MSDALNDPTVQQYHPTVSVPPATPDSGTLPFTGYDALVFMLVALILVLAGIFLRMLAR